MNQTFSKKITFEQFKEINALPMGYSAAKRFDREYSDESVFSMINPESNITHNETMIKIFQDSLVREEEVIEYLENLLIIELEEDKDSHVYQGKLHTSYQYDESKKETQKLVHNTKNRIGRLNTKITTKITENTNLIALQKIFDEVEDQ